jgi:hypothetical protein
MHGCASDSDLLEYEIRQEIVHHYAISSLILPPDSEDYGDPGPVIFFAYIGCASGWCRGEPA